MPPPIVKICEDRWILLVCYRYPEPDDLIERATGRPPETAPYIRYLRTKFGDLYDLK